ncbi:hypothetical protein BC828DRAFT_375362 [Blastocladiella britannica]|nr:hypothetical protein BC828DRAFT_375362 [Blastocladiella britannica]
MASLSHTSLASSLHSYSCMLCYFLACTVAAAVVPASGAVTHINFRTGPAASTAPLLAASESPVRPILERSDLHLIENISDLATATAYLAIPIMLWYFQRQLSSRFPLTWILGLFCLFIVCCGFTHLLHVFNPTSHSPPLLIAVKALTGLVSVATAAALGHITPKLLSYPARVLRLEEELGLLVRRDQRRAVEGDWNERLRTFIGKFSCDTPIPEALNLAAAELLLLIPNMSSVMVFMPPSKVNQAFQPLGTPRTEESPQFTLAATASASGDPSLLWCVAEYHAGASSRAVPVAGQAFQGYHLWPNQSTVSTILNSQKQVVKLSTIDICYLLGCARYSSGLAYRIDLGDAGAGFFVFGAANDAALHLPTPELQLYSDAFVQLQMAINRIECEQEARNLEAQVVRVERERDTIIEDLHAAKEHVREVMSFVAMTSHELRTPMNAIIGFVDVLLEDAHLTADMRDALDTVRMSSHILLNLINNILDLAKLEHQGSLTLASEPFSVRTCVETCMDLVAKRIEHLDVALNYFIAADMPETFMGDRTRLTQILANLVSNAAKFTEHGEIYVAVSFDPIILPNEALLANKRCIDFTQGIVTGDVNPQLFFTNEKLDDEHPVAHDNGILSTKPHLPTIAMPANTLRAHLDVPPAVGFEMLSPPRHSISEDDVVDSAQAPLLSTASRTSGSDRGRGAYVQRPGMVRSLRGSTRISSSRSKSQSTDSSNKHRAQAAPTGSPSFRAPVPMTSLGGFSNSPDPLSARADISYLYFTVVDTGCGIGGAVMQKLFERFMQDAATAGRTHGTGLGLAISSKLVELHHGKILVQSAPGVGSVFTVALPIQGAAGSGHRSGAPRFCGLRRPILLEELAGMLAPPSIPRPVVQISAGGSSLRSFTGGAIPAEQPATDGPLSKMTVLMVTSGCVMSTKYALSSMVSAMGANCWPHNTAVDALGSVQRLAHISAPGAVYVFLFVIPHEAGLNPCADMARQMLGLRDVAPVIAVAAPPIAITILPRGGARAPAPAGLVADFVVRKPVKFNALQRALARAARFRRDSANLPLMTPPATSVPDPFAGLELVNELDAGTPEPVAPQWLHQSVLVVDDNPINCKVAQRVIASIGLKGKVTTAINGQEALDLLGHEEFDIVMMDVSMPVLDGLEATRRLRRREAERRQSPEGTMVPETMQWVCAMTASALPEEREQCLEAGMNDFIAKPIKKDSVIRTIQSAYFHRVGPTTAGDDSSSGSLDQAPAS